MSEVIHLGPLAGEFRARCCNVPVLELPRDDRMTYAENLVDCPGQWFQTQPLDQGRFHNDPRYVAQVESERATLFNHVTYACMDADDDGHFINFSQRQTIATVLFDMGYRPTHQMVLDEIERQRPELERQEKLFKKLYAPDKVVVADLLGSVQKSVEQAKEGRKRDE